MPPLSCFLLLDRPGNTWFCDVTCYPPPSLLTVHTHVLTFLSQRTSKRKGVQTFRPNSALLLNSAVRELPPVEIHRGMQVVYGDQGVEVRTVRCWVRRFKDGDVGHAGLRDKPAGGRPVTARDQLHQDRAEELICGKQKEVAGE